MISLPPSCTLCLQAKHSILREGRRGKEEEINTSTVISSQNTTWEDGRFHMAPALLGFERSRERQSTFLEGRAHRDPVLYLEKKKHG